MSVATSERKEVKFLARFEDVWAALRRYQVLQGLCWSFLTAALALAALALADFRLELPWSVRAGGLAGATVAVLLVFAIKVLGPLRWWTKPRTAVEIESRFPQLGQRIRTVVQYAGQPAELIESEGVTPSLVDALEEDTERQAEPLPIGRIVPWVRVWAASVLAAIPALVLIGLAISSGEWRTALQRAMLGQRPYTTVEVAPGNLTVEQGESVPLAVRLSGRLKRKVVLFTRAADTPGAAWKAQELAPLDGGPPSKREATLEKLKDPLAYRVEAGPAASPVYRVGVRYPLAFKTFEVALKPPAYTGLKPGTVKGGDLQVVEGTGATFRIAFDAMPSLASLIVTDPRVQAQAREKAKTKTKTKPNQKKSKTPDDAGTTVIPLSNPQAGVFTLPLELTTTLNYRIEAVTTDGRKLPKNRFRIDVREDRPPRVVFEQPDEALEVHPIAEIRNRIRVGDDFGLTKAGIVFRHNNGDEQTLIVKDFEATPENRKTSASLEEMLLLEKLATVPTDSITYYAFAEDNYPGTPKRTETDMRYLDIRPFKREYKTADPSGMEGEGESMSLAELIARQRFNLNRGVRLARHRPSDRMPSEDPLKIASFEETIANGTHELTEGLEGILGRRIEPLHKAEESMLAAVEALDRSRNAEVPNHMEQALRHLIEVRRTLLQIIADNPALAKAMRSFDRTQAQKIRKTKKGEEDAETIAEELEELAEEEDFVYATLAAATSGQQESKAPKGEAGDSDETAKAEPKDSQKGEEPAKGEEKPDGQNGPKGDQGEKAEKGEKGEGAQGEKGQKGEGSQSGKGEKGEKGEGTQGEKGQKGEGSQSGKGEKGEKGEGTQGGDDPKEASGSGTTPGKGRGGKAGEPDDNEDGDGGAKKDGRRDAMERQEKIADRARELEERLRKLEAVSDLAKARMAKAADAAEKASGELARGSSKEAAQTTKAGAGMLHELARQVKGEVAKELADELAMARDLAEELSQREAELAEMAERGAPDSPSDAKGDQGQTPGKGTTENKDGTKPGEKGEGKSGGKGEPGSSPGAGGTGRGAVGGRGDLTDEERLERLEEAARTLEEWLKGASQRAEGKTADQVRDLMEAAKVDEVVERMGQVGDLVLGGRIPEARRDATELSRRLEALAQQLDLLHRGIVAPELAELVEFDRRVAELTADLKTLRTDAEIAAWHREAAALVRDMEKAGLSDAADALRGMLADGGRDGGVGGWHWGRDARHYVIVPVAYTDALRSVSIKFQDRIQDLILKDLSTARDEATPPEYRELVDRYYEVLSKDKSGK